MTDLPRGYRLPSQMEKDFEEWLETALPTVANSGTELEHEIAWAAWQAALASERAKQAEPVALQYRERMGFTCHPDDNPPFPCPQKYALSECRADAAQPAVQGEPTEEMIAEAWREAQGKCNHETPRRIYRVFAAPQAVRSCSWPSRPGS